MKLLRKPFTPASLPLAPVLRHGRGVPATWTDYLGSSWKTTFADGERDARVA